MPARSQRIWLYSSGFLWRQLRTELGTCCRGAKLNRIAGLAYCIATLPSPKKCLSGSRATSALCRKHGRSWRLWRTTRRQTGVVCLICLGFDRVFIFFRFSSRALPCPCPWPQGLSLLMDNLWFHKLTLVSDPWLCIRRESYFFFGLCWCFLLFLLSPMFVSDGPGVESVAFKQHLQWGALAACQPLWLEREFLLPAYLVSLWHLCLDKGISGGLLGELEQLGQGAEQEPLQAELAGKDLVQPQQVHPMVRRVSHLEASAWGYVQPNLLQPPFWKDWHLYHSLHHVANGKPSHCCSWAGNCKEHSR